MLVMLVILVIGITTAFITSLSTTAIQNRRNQTTAEALAQAKEALIGYAVTYGDTHPTKAHGYLPCPDKDGSAGANPEGSSELCGNDTANAIGRLPWRTLGLPALYDGSSECLWYAISGNYKSTTSNTSMNWDTPAQLHLYGSDGNEIAANEVVALVIAPGAALGTNSDRSGSAAPTCGGNYTAAAYLDNDTTHGINNADGATGSFILPHDHRDANGNITLTVNDQFAIITRQDLWTAIQQRIAREAKKCLDDYAVTSGDKYPWAVPVSTSTAFLPLIMGEYNTLFGRLPTRPSVQLAPTPASITSMQSAFSELWSALAVFAASKTPSNLSTMRTKASAAKNAADMVKNDYDGTLLENPARDLENAADNANNLNTSSSTTDITNVQKNIVNAANAFTNAMPAYFPQASGMANTWPASCTLFSSPQWEHWKNLVFYQVAYGYRPQSSGASCGYCLSVEVGGHSLAGSGSYRATVTVAGKKLTANPVRVPTNVGDYLETNNLLPKDDYTQPYKTYRITDAAYQSTNDFVLCLDGKVNCK